MSASHHYPQQLMSPHFTSTSTSYGGHHSGIVAPSAPLLCSSGNPAQYSPAYSNQNMLPQNLHLGGYVGSYNVNNYSYPVNQPIMVNGNTQNSLKTLSSASLSETYENESFKKSTKSTTAVTSSTLSLTSTIMTNDSGNVTNTINNNGGACHNRTNNNNCTVTKTSIKSEHFHSNSLQNNKDEKPTVLNANLTQISTAKEISAASSTSPVSNFSTNGNSLVNKSATSLAPSTQSQTGSMAANSVIDAAGVSTAAAAAYASAIAEAHNIENSAEVGNGILPCHMLTSIDSTSHHSLNGFYPTAGGYLPPGFSSDHLLGVNSGLPTTASSGLTHSPLPSPYCWTASGPQSSHSYNRPVGMHRYVSLTDDIYGSSTNALPTGVPIPSQLSYENNLTSAAAAALGTGAGVNGANYGTSSWPSQYYLSTDDKLADVENCGPSQLNSYMNIPSDRNFYVSTTQHPLQNASSAIDSFTATATAATSGVATMGAAALCSSTAVGSNSNGLDSQTVDLYGGFQQHHLQHLHDSSLDSTTQFLDLIPNQQQSQLPDLSNIYQHELLSHQRQNHIYNSLADNSALMTTPNHSVNMSSASVMSIGPSGSVASKPTSALKTSKTTVRRGRSTKTKTTVSSMPPNATDDVMPFQNATGLPQQSVYGNLDSSMMGGRSSSVSNYSRSLSPFSGGVVSKIPRKSRSRAKDSEEDDGRSVEEKESERRTANNTRERIRVRDINMAFKELAKLCSQHMPNTEERGLTKLGTLLKAVDLIPMLEEKVRQRNMDPRMACLKRNQSADSNQI